MSPVRAVVSLATACLAASPAHAQGELVRFEDGVETRSASGARVRVTLPCPVAELTRLGDRVYLAAGRCGVVRLRLGPRGVEDADQLLAGMDVTSVRAWNGEVLAGVRGAGRRSVDAIGRPWGAGGLGPRAPLPPDAPPDGEFVAPEPGVGGAGEAIAIRVQRSPPAPRGGGRVAAPERHGDTWEVGAEVLAIYATEDEEGFAALARSWLVYRAPVPLYVRVDLMPVGFGFGQRGTSADALGFVSAGLDLHPFALGLGVGATSYRHDGRTPWRPAIAFAAHLRAGYADGIHLAARSGFHLGEHDRAAFTFIDATLQVPLSRHVAVFFRGNAVLEPLRAQLDHGVRAWVRGRGEPGSVALRFTLGWGLTSGFGSARCAACGSARYERAGPATGLGVEGRL